MTFELIISVLDLDRVSEQEVRNESLHGLFRWRFIDIHVLRDLLD